MSTFSLEDQIFATLMAYREASGEKDPGLTAVLCVAHNNAVKKGTTIYSEVTKAFRYSSMSCPTKLEPAGSPKYQQPKYITYLQEIINSLSRFAKDTNPVDWTLWRHINDLVVGILSGVVPDITNGATLYYSTLILDDVPAEWNKSKIVFTTQIGHQKFYREL